MDFLKKMGKCGSIAIMVGALAGLPWVGTAAEINVTDWRLVGKWEGEQTQETPDCPSLRWQITQTTDGHYNLTVNPNTEESYTETGTWSAQNGKMRLRFGAVVDVYAYDILDDKTINFQRIESQDGYEHDGCETNYRFTHYLIERSNHF